jgi:hypothetical protein
MKYTVHGFMSQHDAEALDLWVDPTNLTSEVEAQLISLYPEHLERNESNEIVWPEDLLRFHLNIGGVQQQWTPSTLARDTDVAS